MSRYDPLRDYLIRQTLNELTLSFREIEAIIGNTLPVTAERPQWWANETAEGGHTQRRAWRDARYDAFLLAGLRKVRFKKIS